MDPLPEFPPLHSDPASASAMYRTIAARAVATLPEPEDGAAAGRERLEQHALEQVVALMPGNAAEASLAAQYVACTASAAELLRLANLHKADARLSLQLARQGAAMLREARNTRTSLWKLQAFRRERDANPVTRETDASRRDAFCRHLKQALAELKAHDAAGRATAGPQSDEGATAAA